jgi:alkylhydroperoxidase family enzyme
VNRLRRLDPAEMSEEQLEIYRRFTGGRRTAPGAAFSLAHGAGGLVGPPNAWLLSPPVGRAMERLGGVIRFELGLSPRAQEIAILQVAAFRASEFELYAHRTAGRAAGLSASDVAALEAGGEPELRTDEERAVFAVTRELLATGTLADHGYTAAVAALGERLLLELVVVVGWYQLLATQLAVFGEHPPVS